MATLLTRDDVLELIRWGDVIEVVAQAHAEHAAGRATMPARLAAQIPGTQSAILPMAAAIPALDAAGVKLLSIFPENANTGVPILNAVVVLVDVASGRCTAVVEGGALTAYRTAAASAVATRYLARADSRVLGLLGAGVQARSHLDALRLVRPIERVKVWSRSEETARQFIADTADRDVPVEYVEDPEEVVRTADVLCTVTPSKEPVLRGSWLQPGTHINGIGTHAHDHREIDTESVVRSRVVVDVGDAIRTECGDLNIPVEEGAITPDHFADELGQLVNGDRPGRRDSEEITLYKSVGVAIQDIATAAHLLKLAQQNGVGQRIAI